MGTFRYRAKENSGNTVEGVIEALTSDEAVEKINQLGLLPVRVEEAMAAAPKQESTEKQDVASSVAPPAASAPKIKGIGGSVKSKEITAFGRQLSSLIRSGVPILRAIGVIHEQSENPKFKGLLSRIHEEVKNGAPFSSALSKYPRYFPLLYLALVSAGEASGTLDKTLATITDYRQKQEEIFSRVRTAMIYPAIMALTGVGTIVFMLTFVMPKLMGIFANLGGDLPLPTRILINLSHACRTGWFWGAVAIVTFSIVLVLRKKSKGQNLFLSALSLRVPVFGSFVLKAEIARFARTLELLLKSGVSILKAIETTAPVLGNVVLRNELIRCLQDLKEGGSLGKSLKKSKRFPLFMTNLLMIGEEAGKMDEALSEIALFYERETDEAIRAMTSLLEPLMILGMGLVVGFIVIAMLLPMFELNMAVK